MQLPDIMIVVRDANGNLVPVYLSAVELALKEHALRVTVAPK